MRTEDQQDVTPSASPQSDHGVSQIGLLGSEGNGGTHKTARRIQVEITWGSIFRVVLGVMLVYLAVLLWPILKLLILASIVAVALYPIVMWCSRRGLPRWFGLTVASATIILVIVGLFAVVAPLVFRQAYALGENLPRLMQEAEAHLPPSGFLEHTFKRLSDPSTVSGSQRVLDRVLAVATSTVGGLFEFLMIVGFAIYLMVDGPRALKWLVVFFPVHQRQKIACALEETAHMIFAFVAGQFIISVLCALFVFTMLTFLGVPMALLLGIIAGVLDVLPVLGFTVAVALSMAVGLTVSPSTALLILALYGPYHLFENLVLIPRVYGKRLRLSAMVVPLALMAGGLVAGVGGAIAALPLVAVYPVVEKLWLGSRLAPDTVKEHESRN